MTDKRHKPLICRIAAAPFSVNKFLRFQIDEAIGSGYDVIVITGYDDELFEYCESKNIKYLNINIERRFTPLKDLVSLYKIIKHLKFYDVDCIHTISSKGGLLGTLAGKFLGVKCIMHIYAGLPWCEMSGRLCTVAYADSDSEKNFVVNEGICNSDKIKVLGHGSVSGFDISRYQSVDLESKSKAELKRLNIVANQKIILFVGRVTKEKGVGERVEAFDRLSTERSDVTLLLVGPYEENIDPLNQSTIDLITHNENILHLGYRRNPEIYYALSEFLVLPSYREGFGNVILEAAATGIPAIGTNIFGLSDSIIDNQTGVLVECKDVGMLYSAIKMLLDNDDLKNELGENARKRARDCFSKEYVNRLMMLEYRKYLDR